MSKTNDPTGTKVWLEKYPYLAPIIRKLALVYVIIQYIWASRLHIKFNEFSNYRLFRYEDLLAEPQRVTQELCQFLEITFLPEMIDLDKSQHEHQPSSHTGKRKKGYDKCAASRWKAVISPFEKKLITLFTKDSMKRFEYDPSSHPIYS